jgi:IPT/TIG domain
MDQFVVTELWAHLLSAGLLVLLLIVAHVLIVRTDKTRDQTLTGFRRRGVKALAIGEDGRASTSKVQVLLWTFALLYALTFLLVWGRAVGCDGEDREDLICRRAAVARTTLGRLVEAPLDTEYYSLLGLPTLAAIAARKMTQNKLDRGEKTKESIDEALGIQGRGVQKRELKKQAGVSRGLSEVITNDRGETDLIDFQYFAFNLVALGYFVLEFVDTPLAGLPEIPPTLLALSGVAVAAYSGKKALEKDAVPTITAVVPRRVRLSAGSKVIVTGSGFGRRDLQSLLLIGGVAIDVDTWSDRRIEVTLNADAVDALSDLGITADVSVMQRDGLLSADYPVELVRRSGRRGG